MFISCACNSEARRAFVPCSPCSRFDQKPLFMLFAVPFAVSPFAVSVGLCPVFMRSCFAVPFAVPLHSNTFNVHFKRFVGLFKRLFPFLRTFAPFAPFQAVTEPQTRQKRRYAGVGWDYPPPPKPKRREAQLSPHRILKFLKNFF